MEETEVAEFVQSVWEPGEWREMDTKLRRFCCFLTQSRWDGEDLAQETILKGMAYGSDISMPFLKTVARHTWIDWLRKRKRETVRELDDLVETASGAALEVMEHLAGRLTPRQAVIFVLKIGFQYQAKEIAALLQTTEAAVKAAIHRTRRNLESEADVSVNQQEWLQHEKLDQLLTETIRRQDPDSLIKALPDIFGKQPKAALSFHPSFCTLSMAA